MSAQPIGSSPALSNSQRLDPETPSANEPNIVTKVYSRAVSPTNPQTSKGSTDALRDRASPTPSSADSEISTEWADPKGLLSREPVDIFEIDPGDNAQAFKDLGYEVTNEEWDNIIKEGSTGSYGGLESHSANFAIAKLAMKKLDPKMFWQAVHHLSAENFDKLESAVQAFAALVKSVEECDEQDIVTEVFSRAVSPTNSQTSKGSTDALSDASTEWSDPEGLLSREPVDIFEVDPGDNAQVFVDLGYEATEEEWKEIIEEGSTGSYGGLESHSANFGVVKLAMWKLNPKMFWQAVDYLSAKDRDDLKIALKAFAALIKSVEEYD